MTQQRWTRRGLVTALGAGVAWPLVAAAAPPVRSRRARQRPADVDVGAKSNGDEARIPGYGAVFAKGLAHGPNGLVDGAAYRGLVGALGATSADSARVALERLPLGGQRKLENPLASFAFPLVGPPAESYGLAPAPLFDGEEQAAELLELAWLAVLRDVPFAFWDESPLVARACAELSRSAGYRGPRDDNGAVTPRTLARGPSPAELAGPMVSQLLLKDLALRPLRIEQQFRGLAPGVDHTTQLGAWRELMRGAIPGPNRLDDVPRYPRCGRDLAEACRRDLGYQAFFCAGSTLLAWGTPIDGGNPYKHSRTQAGFATWGSMSMLNLLGLVADAAFAVCWYEKWRIHRRLRPEEYAGRLELVRRGELELPFPPGLLASEALGRLLEAHGSVLLPQAYAEGCPLHPSYPAGHAVVAGACATVLKAFFDESWAIPEPVVPSADGTSLERWRGGDLAVGGELDKLASAMAVGRDWAGIHWWSDTAAGLELGERIASAVLAEVRERLPEQLGEMSFVGFDGRRRVV